jgi:hypothetical protein
LNLEIEHVVAVMAELASMPVVKPVDADGVVSAE